MSQAWYERLSGLDRSFLAFETREAHMHVAITTIFDARPLTAAGGGLDVARIRAYVRSRLPAIPRYRQRLHVVPVVNGEVWVDDARFDLDYHVRHASLPRPGTDAQLRDRCAEILERPLHRGHPLWEAWIIEGLEHERMAVLFKVHHCMVDGIAGIHILATLLSPSPMVRGPDPLPWRPRPVPTDAQLLRDEAARRVRGVAGLARATARGLREPGEAARTVAGRLGALAGLARAGFGSTKALPWNGTIGPHRRLAWFSFDLAAVKQVKNALGGTVNDVVLATVAGALRRLVGDPRAERTARVAVPVSVRAEDEAGVAGNRVSAWLLGLPIGERDPLRRFERVRRTTVQMKDEDEATGVALLAEAADWTDRNLLHLGVRLLNGAKAYDLIVTNVPGPQTTLHLLEAPLLAAYPHLPLFENQGLGIALFSYAGRLFWGVAADWDLVPDVEVVRAAVDEAFGELCAAAGPAGDGAVARGPRDLPAIGLTLAGAVPAA
jgi:WS/DGAT/MGAT family acyltransferase